MAGRWIKGNRPKLEPKISNIVEEAIMQLVEIERFVYGYDYGTVTAADSTKLVDDQKSWEVGRWERGVDPYDRYYHVAVRHSGGVWEWQYISTNTATEIVTLQWKEIPAVGSPYLVTPERPWCPWMWDEEVKAGVQIGLVFHENLIQLSKYPIVASAENLYHLPVQTWRGSFGLFGAKWHAKFYGGNAADVFETEVNTAPAASGEYQVNYATGQVLIHENSPRPNGVLARYVGAVWPPGFKSGTRGGVTDFYGALWHYSVKGEDATEGDYDPGASSLEDIQYIATDTFTKLRRGIELLCQEGRVWDSARGKLYTMQELYNAANVFGYLWDEARGRGMTVSVGWNADLSRGVGRALPEGAEEDYGRTWVVAIEEILKCLEKMQVLVVSTVSLEPSAAHKFSQQDNDSDAEWNVAGGKAHTARVAAAWGGGGAWEFGVEADMTLSGGIYYCTEACNRLFIIADTKYREGYTVGNMWLTLENVRPTGFIPFFAVVGLDDGWDYGDSFDETNATGAASDEILITGEEGDTDVITLLLNPGIFENQLPMLFCVRHAWEWVQIFPPASPPTGEGYTAYGRQSIEVTDMQKVYLLCEPNLTFIGV